MIRSIDRVFLTDGHEVGSGLENQEGVCGHTRPTQGWVRSPASESVTRPVDRERKVSRLFSLGAESLSERPSVKE